MAVCQVCCTLRAPTNSEPVTEFKTQTDDREGGSRDMISSFIIRTPKTQTETMTSASSVSPPQVRFPTCITGIHNIKKKKKRN